MSYSCLNCDNEVDGETCPRVNSSIDDEGFYKSHCLCEMCYMKVINFIVGHEHFSITPKLVITDKSQGKVEAEVDPDDAMIVSGPEDFGGSDYPSESQELFGITILGHDVGCIMRSITSPGNGCTCKALIDPPACAGKKDNGGV